MRPLHVQYQRLDLTDPETAYLLEQVKTISRAYDNIVAVLGYTPDMRDDPIMSVLRNHATVEQVQEEFAKRNNLIPFPLRPTNL